MTGPDEIHTVISTTVTIISYCANRRAVRSAPLKWKNRRVVKFILHVQQGGEKGEKRSVGGAVTLLPAVRAESADSSAVATRDQKCLFIFYVYILKEIELGERSPPARLSVIFQPKREEKCK